jgi:universal stress protein E
MSGREREHARAATKSIGGRTMPDRKFERILVAIADPAAGVDKAARRAAVLAHATGAGIDLFHAIPQAMSAGLAHAAAEQFTRWEFAEASRLLEKIANRLRREELVVTTGVHTGFPVHTAILRRVRETKADLVIIEARKHSVFARLLLTQTDFELIRHCPVPLLIVKGRTAWRSPRVLAALDPFHPQGEPNALDDAIVAAAGTLAALTRGSWHAAHVYRRLPVALVGVPLGPALPEPMPAQERKHGIEMRRRFAAMLARHGIPRGRGHLVSGDPVRELPRLARSLQVSLVVMGATSRSGFKRIFVGHTAEHVLDRLACDVLVVKAGS